LNDRFPVDPLLDVVDRAFAFHNHDLQASRGLAPRRKACKIEQKKKDQEKAVWSSGMYGHRRKASE
jgi:hypothetical protein